MLALEEEVEATVEAANAKAEEKAAIAQAKEAVQDAEEKDKLAEAYLISRSPRGGADRSSWLSRTSGLTVPSSISNFASRWSGSSKKSGGKEPTTAAAAAPASTHLTV